MYIKSVCPHGVYLDYCNDENEGHKKHAHIFFRNRVFIRKNFPHRKSQNHFHEEKFLTNFYT